MKLLNIFDNFTVYEGTGGTKNLKKIRTLVPTLIVKMVHKLQSHDILFWGNEIFNA